MVRDPPRKSEQATYRAVCSRGRRAQRRRREPATCTEWRLRNGRRWPLRLRVHGPQRKRRRRILEPVPTSRGSPSRSSRLSRYLRETFLDQRDCRASVRSLELVKELETKARLTCSNCTKGESITIKWQVMYGLQGCKIWTNIDFVVSFGMLRWDNRAIMDTPGQQYSSILFWWMVGLDWVFAHASLTTLTVLLES